MQDERSCGPADEQSTDHAAQAVLGVLVSRHPGLVPFDELVRELSEAPEQYKFSELALRDAITDLVAGGLAYRLDRFLMASWPAIQARALIEDRLD